MSKNETAKDEDIGEIEPDEVVNAMPDDEVLDRAFKDYFLAASDQQSAVGTIGALVKKNEDQFNIHRKAFKLTAQIEKMDETKRSEFLAHLFHYIGARGLAPHPDLFEDDRAKEIAKASSRDDALLAEAESATVQ